jgi:hypothetical protein
MHACARELHGYSHQRRERIERLDALTGDLRRDVHVLTDEERGVRVFAVFGEGALDDRHRDVAGCCSLDQPGGYVRRNEGARHERAAQLFEDDHGFRHPQPDAALLLGQSQ